MTITTVTPISAQPKAARVLSYEQNLTAALKAVSAMAVQNSFYLTMERDLLVTLIAERRKQAQLKGMSKLKAVA